MAKSTPKKDRPLKVKAFRGLKKPFPYYGSKEKAAPLIWDTLDPKRDLRLYAEPFAGSLSMLLQSPRTVPNEVVGDLDASIINFWRAARAEPLRVAEEAVRPVSDVEMWAAEHFSRGWAAKHAPRLSADLGYYDTHAAGVWLYGQCNFLASNFGSCAGPWVVAEDAEGFRVMASPTGDGEVVSAADGSGMGIRAQAPELMRDRGIGAQIPDLVSDRGVRATAAQTRADRVAYAHAVLAACADRLTTTRLICSSWEKVVTPGLLAAYATWRAGIFLDPPYDDALGGGGGQDYACSIDAGASVSAEVEAWCARVTREGLKQRIILCGRYAEHDALLEIPGWSKRASVAKGSYGPAGSERHKAEALWCFLPPEESEP